MEYNVRTAVLLSEVALVCQNQNPVMSLGLLTLAKKLACDGKQHIIVILKFQLFFHKKIC